MKVLRISHYSTASGYRERDRVLASRFGIDLFLIMPVTWHDLGGEHDTSLAEPFQMEQVGILGAGNVPLFALDPLAIRKAIIKFKPDIVDIQEEPYSVSGFQSAWLSKQYAPQAACVFYSAQNIVKKYPPPFRWSERFVYRYAGGAYPCSQGVQDTLREKGFHKPAPIIPLGFDPKLFRRHLLSDDERVLKREQLGLRGLTVGFFGRIVECKGLTYLLEAVAQVADQFECTVMVVGSGEFQSSAETLAKQLGIESKVRWLGERPAGQMPELLSLCDVVAIPSLTTRSWKEQYGRIAIEGMACGVPVIASDSGSLPEVLGGCGLIFKEKSATAISEQLIRLHCDEELRHDLSRRGAELALLSTWESVGRMMFDLYTSVCKPG